MVKGLYGECVEQHHVYITDRGGTRRVAELVDVAEVQWTRVRDDVSKATVQIRGAACSAQAAMLRNIEAKRNEMVIYRGDSRVWEGPVDRVAWHGDWVEIEGHDVTEYLFGRPLSQAWNDSKKPVTVTSRLKRIIEWELTHPFTYYASNLDPVSIPGWEQLFDIDPVTGLQVPRPANVLPYLMIHEQAGDPRTSASTTPFQMTVGEHLDNYARSGGIDYVTVGRTIHVWDVDKPLGRTRTLTEADFFGEVIVTAYGSDHASVAFAVAQDGRYGGAGGIPTDWKFLQKSGVHGTFVDLDGAEERRPSIVDAGPKEWQGSRYWMAYQPNTPATMRIASSSNKTTWKSAGREDVDADPGTSGTPPAPITVSTGNWPALAFGWEDTHLWLFFIGANGHLYRTRSEDGDDWTSQIDIYTPAAGVTLVSPSLYYSPVSEQWVLFGVNTQTNRIVYMTSTNRLLDATGQWGTLNAASVAGNPDIASVEMRRIGSRWVGLATTTGNQVLIIESHDSTAASGFASSGSALSGAGTVVKATWLQREDGNLDIWYGRQTGDWNIYKSSLNGPAPDIGRGDVFMDYYGPWAKVHTVFDEDDTTMPTQEDLNSQARRNLNGRSPVPVTVRVPDNSGIRLSPGLQIDDLVPGVFMPLLATLNARTLSQMQKLDKLTVTETSEGETIQVVLIPASTRDDTTEEEGGGT